MIHMYFSESPKISQILRFLNWIVSGNFLLILNNFLYKYVNYISKLRTKIQNWTSSDLFFITFSQNHRRQPKGHVRARRPTSSNRFRITFKRAQGKCSTSHSSTGQTILNDFVLNPHKGTLRGSHHKAMYPQSGQLAPHRFRITL